jgi:hypothetical protein
MVHCVDSLTNFHFITILEGFDQVIEIVKTQFIIVCDLLVLELE